MNKICTWVNVRFGTREVPCRCRPECYWNIEKLRGWVKDQLGGRKNDKSPPLLKTTYLYSHRIAWPLSKYAPTGVKIWVKVKTKSLSIRRLKKLHTVVCRFYSRLYKLKRVVPIYSLSVTTWPIARHWPDLWQPNIIASFIILLVVTDIVPGIPIDIEI